MCFLSLEIRAGNEFNWCHSMLLRTAIQTLNIKLLQRDPMKLGGWVLNLWLIICLCTRVLKSWFQFSNNKIWNVKDTNELYVCINPGLIISRKGVLKLSEIDLACTQPQHSNSNNITFLSYTLNRGDEQWRNLTGSVTSKDSPVNLVLDQWSYSSTSPNWPSLSDSQAH
jgi:hypothetical protein